MLGGWQQQSAECVAQAEDAAATKLHFYSSSGAAFEKTSQVDY
jgi:hypothetical protein